MRLVAITGMRISSFSRAVTQAKAARGTMVAMVGMRASCQPMPVLIIVAPARLDAVRERQRLFERAAVLDEIEHRQAKDQDEIRSHRRARARDDLQGEPAAVLKAAAPRIACAGWCAAPETG